MIRAGNQRGLSLVELLVSLVIFSLAMASIAGLLIHNSRMNRAAQINADLQSSARACLSMITDRIRSAGWDPQETGFAAVVLDPDLSDDVSILEIRADLNGDGDIDDIDETMSIRHSGEFIEWRRTVAGSWEPLAGNISNDEDDDGTPEPMFTPDSTVDPTTIAVRITAAATKPDPRTGVRQRYTMATRVVLREAL